MEEHRSHALSTPFSGAEQPRAVEWPPTGAFGDAQQLERASEPERLWVRAERAERVADRLDGGIGLVLMEADRAEHLQTDSQLAAEPVDASHADSFLCRGPRGREIAAPGEHRRQHHEGETLTVQIASAPEPGERGAPQPPAGDQPRPASRDADET